MKTSLKLFCCSLLFAACNGVYLEKPVPISGKEVAAIPDNWTGLFEMKAPDMPDNGSLFKECLLMERINDNQLLISSDIRLAKADMPALKALFVKEKMAGRLASFQITDRFISSVTTTETANDGIGQERQITTLVEQGNWYIVTKSIKPVMMIDLATKSVITYDMGMGSTEEHQLIPEGDSLSAISEPLVFRQKKSTYFLNIQKENQPKWSLYTIEPADHNNLTVKMTFLKDKTMFEKRFSHFNKITPFQSVNSDYFINPTDEALDLLLADQDLFESWNLVRL